MERRHSTCKHNFWYDVQCTVSEMQRNSGIVIVLVGFHWSRRYLRGRWVCAIRFTRIESYNSYQCFYISNCQNPDNIYILVNQSSLKKPLINDLDVSHWVLWIVFHDLFALYLNYCFRSAMIVRMCQKVL